MKSSCHSLIHFLLLFCNCHFQRLDLIPLLPSSYPGRLASRNSTLHSTLLKSKSKLYYDRRSAGQSVLEQSPHLGLTTRSLLHVWQLRSCSSGAPSLTRGRVCLLYVLLALASAVFLGSESCGTWDHLLLSLIWDFRFRRLLRLAGSRWTYSIPPPHGYFMLLKSKSVKVQVKVMLRPTVSRPVCVGIKHPFGAYDQILIIVWQLRVCWFGAPSLTRGRVCRLQLLLALASSVIFGSESRRTRGHILLSLIRDFPFRPLPL
jgi:hypothetical protein